MMPIADKNVEFLIVDDDPMMRMILRETVGKITKSIALAEDGFDAFDQYVDRQPAIILTDIRMPRCDGIQMIEKIRRENDEETIIFVCSGYSDLTPGMAEELKIRQVIEKPFDLRELRRILKETYEQLTLDRTSREERVLSLKS